jgi:alpha-beta hydrolase superfamily lysophospholipase
MKFGDFGIDQAAALQALLPELDFAPEFVGISRDNPLLAAYLGCYQLDFSARVPGVRHVLGTIDAAGFRIATQYWIPPQARGTLLVVHGYYDHVGIYDKVIAFGLEQGLAVLAFDLPGHGLSSGERAAIESFDQYGDVLEAVLGRARGQLPSPWYGLGQSTGGAVLLNHLWRYDNSRPSPWLDKLALCAPLILPRGWTRGRWLYMLVHKFVHRLPRGRSRSSHDEDFIRFLDEQDCLQSRFLSVRWVGAMKNWHAQFLRWQALDKPVLILQGTDDQTVAWRYNLTQIQSRLPQARVQFIDGAGHQLVNERNDFREQVFVTLRDYFCTLP